MKLLPDYKMHTIDTITASSVDALFPAANLKEYDPAVIFKAGGFLADVTLVIDLLVARSVKNIWLNNANFVNATLQANDTNSWTSPAVSKNVTLAADDVGVIKGYFELSLNSYRYIRILIPVQALTDGENVPSLGNVIVGSDVTLSPVSKWSPDVNHEFYSFVADGGSYFKTQKTKPRHVFSVTMEHITKPDFSALPLNGWQHAIVFTDLGDVADSYLVYPPAGRKSEVLNNLDCSTDFVLEELV